MFISVSGHTCTGKSSVLEGLYSYLCSRRLEVCYLNGTPREELEYEDYKEVDLIKLEYSDGFILKLFPSHYVDDQFLELSHQDLTNPEMFNPNLYILSDRSFIDALAYHFLAEKEFPDLFHNNENFDMEFIKNRVLYRLASCYQHYVNGIHIFISMPDEKWFDLYSKIREYDIFGNPGRISHHNLSTKFESCYREAVKFINEKLYCNLNVKFIENITTDINDLISQAVDFLSKKLSD